jgi:flagellar protein FlbD
VTAHGWAVDLPHGRWRVDREPGRAMIVVTRLNGSGFAVNPDLVERIQETPDTTLIMVDGAKYIVTESMAEVIDMIAQYRARIVRLAYGPAETAEPQRHDAYRHTGPQPALAPVADLAAARQDAGTQGGVR